MTRDEISTAPFTIALVMSLLGGGAFEAQAQSWPNEPAGSGLILDCNFSSALCNGALWTAYGGSATASLSDAPMSPSSVFENKLPGTNTNGGHQVGISFNPFKPELYFGIWWKMNSTFEGFPNNTNKLLFTVNGLGDGHFFGPYGPANAPSWTFAYNVQSFNGIDNSQMGNSWGVFKFGNGCQVVRNTWYRLEAYLKKSTTATSQDGIVRWWINGQLCGNYTNFNFPGGVESWQINHAWDGATNTGWKTKDWIHWFDHVRISQPNGAGDVSKSDTTAPGTPTGLRVQ